MSPLQGRINLVGISGPSRCGKDTLARMLVDKFSYQQHSFAAPIYAMLNTLPGLAALHSGSSTQTKETVHSRYSKSPRQMLQTLGTEWGRNLVHQDIWVRILESRLEFEFDCELFISFVISDLRFPNEAAWIRKLGGICIRMHRQTVTALATNHVSDAGLVDDLIDMHVLNNAGIEQLNDYIPAIHKLAQQRRSAAQVG
jgi:hypothetical protein